MTRTTPDDVDDVVSRLADALARRDAAGCAALWGTSATIIADAFDATPRTPAALEGFLAPPTSVHPRSGPEPVARSTTNQWSGSP